MKILHISDLHWGRKFSPIMAIKLKEFIEKEKPELIAISGDLTQRAKKREFIAVKRYLASIGIPYISVPGNHDVPLYPVHLRFFFPFLRYKNYFCEEIEPEFINEKFCIFGLCSAHSFTSSEGRIKKSQIKKLRLKILRASPSQKIIIMIHHPVIWADPLDRDRTIYGANELIELFMELPPDLILSGHYHHRFFFNLKDFYSKLPKNIYLIFSSTPTTERGRKKEKNSGGLNLIKINEKIKVEFYLFSKDDFKSVEEIYIKG